MLVIIPVLVALLIRSRAAMEAASSACRLFLSSVMPGLFPYMTLTLLLSSRCKRLPLAGAVLLGWGGGSPMGAKVTMGFEGNQRRFVLIASATMSPMFLLGTVGQWLGGTRRGAMALMGMLLGGLLTGWMACARREMSGCAKPVPPQPISLPQAVEQAMKTMLTICGTMMLARTLLTLMEPVVPEAARIPLAALMEAATGMAAIAETPWPLPLKTALMAGTAAFGGCAILMQNRAAAPDVMSLPEQALWQLLHGGISFLLTLGLAMRL